MRIQAATLLISFSLFGAAHAQAQTSAGTIVNNFVPTKFTDRISSTGHEVSIRSCFSVYSSTPDGQPSIIMAGYVDGYDGAIRVLGRQGNGAFSVLYEPANLAVGGVGCNVELSDVDGDGVAEVQFSFTSPRGADSNWIFKWDGSQLTSLTPTSDTRGKTFPMILNGALIDVYHDGTLQLFSSGQTAPAEGDSAVNPSFLYRLQNGKYVLDTPILTIRDVFRSEGQPAVQEVQFSPTTRSLGPYVLLVVNGDRGGANRVSSAQISLNGQAVAFPNDFNQQVERLTIPLAAIVAGTNTLSVILNGKPGGHIQLLVEDGTPGIGAGH